MYQHGELIKSVGGTFTYEVIGACCRLYDREELPYPCCRLQWKGKEPFWNRVGRRFVPDNAAKRCESYSVKLLDSTSHFVYTLYWKRIPYEEQCWWYTVNKKRERYAAEVEICDGYTEQVYWQAA